MKHLFLMLALAVIVTAASAQTATFSTAGGTMVEPTGNYTLTNTTAQWFQFNGYTDWITTQDFHVKLDSLTGNHTNVAVSFWGRKFNTGSWTQIGSTVNWKGTSVDTVIVISNTSGARWREYKANFQGTGTGTTKVYLLKLKLWFQ